MLLSYKHETHFCVNNWKTKTDRLSSRMYRKKLLDEIPQSIQIGDEAIFPDVILYFSVLISYQIENQRKGNCM